MSAPAAPTNPVPAKEKDFLEFIKLAFDSLNKNILNVLPEYGFLAPIICIFGVGFLSLVSMNFPLGLFAAASVEASLLSSVFQLASDYLYIPNVTATDEAGEQCKSGLLKMDSSRFIYFLSRGLKGEFPNSPLYFIGFATAYCIQSMLIFSKESSELGPQYSNRPYMALIGASLIILLLSIYLYANSCEKIITLFLSLVIGLFIGIVLCYQNYLLFGNEGVNLLFIPPLSKRKGMDYLCVTASSQK